MTVMKRLRLPMMLMMVPALLGLAAGVYAATNFQVIPSRYDPSHTYLVQATWLDGIGCPTNARVDATGSGSTTPYSDPACATGDRDPHNQGLLLAKTGPTANNAAGQAVIRGAKGTITELGYDIRKPVSSADPRGSHCGAGAPRFDITTNDGKVFFIGCNSPPATSQTPGNGWVRLRWGASTQAFPQFGGATVALSSLNVKSIAIVFDEGQDAGPDNFGLAVLDNIDVNGTLVGTGPSGHDTNGGGKGKGHDDDEGRDD